MDNAVRIIGNCIKWMLVKPMGIAKNPKTLARAHMTAMKAICLELILTFFLYPLLGNRLYLLDLAVLSNFISTSNQEEISNPLSEIYRTMGLPQYMQETQEKKIIEKLLLKEK